VILLDRSGLLAELDDLSMRHGGANARAALLDEVVPVQQACSATAPSARTTSATLRRCSTAQRSLC
jgi:hypothetical protein